MSRFLPEPSFSHDRAARLGVLLLNLGTPEAPTAAAVGSAIVIAFNSCAVRGRQAANRRLLASSCSVVMFGSIIERICELS